MGENKSRTYNSIRNIVYSIGNQMITLFLSFFSRTIFIKILGENYLGINGLFSEVLMMLSLADLGLGSAMVYSFYKPLAENDTRKISALINFYNKIYKIIALAVAIIGICLVPFIEFIVELDTPTPHLKLYYLIFLMNSVVSYLFVYKTSILQADQKVYLINKYTAITSVLKICTQIIVLILTHNYILFLLVQVSFTLINNLLAARKSTKLYPFLNSDYQLNKNEKLGIFENIKSVFLYKVAGVLLNGTDNMLISKLVGTNLVGLYSNYNLVVSTITNFISIGFRSLNASIGNLITENNYKKRYEVFNILQVISFIMGGVCSVCLYTLMNDLIRIWIGEKYLLSDFTLLAIIINFYIACVLQPIWSYREATGLFKKIKYIMLITATVNLFLSIALGIKFGVGGIIISSAIAKVTTYFWYEPTVLFREYFKKTVKKYFMKQIINFIIVIILLFIFSKLSRLISIYGWMELIVKSIVIFLGTSLSFILIYIRSDELKFLISKLKIKRG